MLLCTTINRCSAVEGEMVENAEVEGSADDYQIAAEMMLRKIPTIFSLATHRKRYQSMISLSASRGVFLHMLKVAWLLGIFLNKVLLNLL
mmetsp:Transcript_5540/g.13398  ORF Transcript_5540/g.13398 Transcript_5540/m.13398 type:complete len:90 (+) Transcript_5540:184-453(+)